jgi:ATP-binding cassette, subfamily C, bacteriocin exporter
LDLESEKNAGTIDIGEIGTLEICLQNVSFAYPGRPPIFQKVDARFLPSEITLIRGESGSRKSSILALPQRFYLPSEGRLFFGQYEIRYLRSSSLRTQIGVVPQKIDLMSGTVIENITLGEFEPDMRNVLAICTKLGMLDFIQSLPEGFETRLAENGRNLSGGQPQRLAIARALYADAPVYLFDEPMAALDEFSGQRFLNVLQELRGLGKIHDIVPFCVNARENNPRRGTAGKGFSVCVPERNTVRVLHCNSSLHCEAFVATLCAKQTSSLLTFDEVKSINIKV